MRYRAGPDEEILTPIENVVGPGTEITNFGLQGQSLNIDFSDKRIHITRASEPANGRAWWVEFRDVHGTIPPFISVIVNPATTWPGYTPSRRVYFEADLIRLWLNGPGQSSRTDQIVLDLIPEPAAAGLLLMAFVFLLPGRGCIRNRKELS